MPNAKDTYITTLKKAHLEWGTHRYTGSRDLIYGEGYLQLPLKTARQFGIYSSNVAGSNNIFTCSSTDGFLKNVQLKAAGSTGENYQYAKQFHGNGDLKIIGRWYEHIGAKVGDRVKISWTTPTNMIIEKL